MQPEFNLSVAERLVVVRCRKVFSSSSVDSKFVVLRFLLDILFVIFSEDFFPAFRTYS